MPIANELNTQNDFTGGQINRSARRRDDLPLLKAGALQLLNLRTEAEGTALTRPGRRALYPTSKRSEYYRLSGTVEVQIHFSAGKITVTDLAGNTITENATVDYLWDDTNVDQISIAQFIYDLYICFPGMRPQVLTWDRNSNTFKFIAFTFSIAAGDLQEPFYRTSALGAAMEWDTTTFAYKTIGSSLTLTCTANYFLSDMVGSRLSIMGGQVEITAVSSPTVATVLVHSILPDSIVFTVTDGSPFLPGEIAGTTNTSIKIEVVSVTSTTVTGPLSNGVAYLASTAGTADTLSSPVGSSDMSGYALYTGGTTATLQWQEEFMSDNSGWPGACFYSHSRLGFCQFPQRPDAILWSAIGAPTVCYIDTVAAIVNAAAGVNANAAILEYVDDKPSVLNVAGAGDSFVFTDHGIFYIPISGTNPLKPGSVEFRRITNDGCSPIRPIPFMDSIIYINAGGTRVSVIKATGAVTLPYQANDITDLHNDLFNAPVTLAVTAGDGAPERLVYVLNGDGTLVIGKFAQDSGIIGWHPETSDAFISWVVADAASVFYNATYPNSGTPVTLMEVEDANEKLDAKIVVNSPPANMVKGGMGPFWWLTGSVITLAENGVDLGDRTIDGSGFIIKLPGEIITDDALIGGTPFPKAYEPVIRQAPPGPSQHQRIRRRSITAAMLTVEADCEFTWGNKLVRAYDFGDDGSAAPAFTSKSIKIKPIGRTYDPTVVMNSSRYGTIRILECSVEVSI